MGRMMRIVLCSIAFAATYMILEDFVSADTPMTPSGKGSHSQCGQCHKGHGMRGTAMLIKPTDELCSTCHGPSGKNKDVYSVVIKPSAHPVIQTSRYHLSGEELPERNPSDRRHVSCSDCHNVHASEKGNPTKGLQGYSGRGVKTSNARNEYEICYRCHSDSANLPRSKNVMVKFSSSNPSYHPLETYGKNTFVPSLMGGYSRSSIIKCSNCHGNNDPSGPQGPHGSIYAPILKLMYNRTQGPESPTTYALCYQCHSRTSILNDESFKAHKAHVVYNQISCAQCHDSHGSTMNPSLISFDKSAFPNSKGELIFTPGVSGRPKCFLSCHVSGRIFEHISPDPFRPAAPPCDKSRYAVRSNFKIVCPQEWQF